MLGLETRAFSCKCDAFSRPPSRHLLIGAVVTPCSTVVDGMICVRLVPSLLLADFQLLEPRDLAPCVLGLASPSRPNASFVKRSCRKEHLTSLKQHSWNSPCRDQSESCPTSSEWNFQQYRAVTRPQAIIDMSDVKDACRSSTCIASETSSLAFRRDMIALPIQPSKYGKVYLHFCNCCSNSSLDHFVGDHLFSCSI